MDKPDLLANIRRDRATLDTLVFPLSESQLASHGADGGWTVKDHLAHIAAWERMIVAHLHDGSDAAIAGMDEASYATASLDALNDRLYQMSRDRPLGDVMREFADAHQAIVAFLEALPERQLATAYWDDDPSLRSVLDKISGDTYLHYQEHAAWIGEIIGRGVEAG